MKITFEDIGKLVELPIKPDWGPGIILKVDNDYAQIHFRDCQDKTPKKYQIDENPLVLAARQTDPLLSLPSPSSRRINRKPRATRLHLDFNQAVDRFLSKYPGRFTDPTFLGDIQTGMRLSLANASNLFGESFGDHRLEKMLSNWEMNVIAEKMNQIIPSLRFLSRDVPRIFTTLFRDMAQAFSYFEALSKVLRDPALSHDGMNPYFEKVKACPVEGINTWSASTALLFLAQPSRHIFVKPSIAKGFAVTPGYQFQYETFPNWWTYYSLTNKAGEFLEKLRPLGAVDLIDVYLFLVVAQDAATEKATI